MGCNRCVARCPLAWTLSFYFVLLVEMKRGKTSHVGLKRLNRHLTHNTNLSWLTTTPLSLSPVLIELGWSLTLKAETLSS